MGIHNDLYLHKKINEALTLQKLRKFLSNTIKQYKRIIKESREIFEKKTKDYGTAWRILRASSLTDQLYIKACRIRTFQEKGVQKIEESIDGEFVALVNYSIMALIQLEETVDLNNVDISLEQALEMYDKQVEVVTELMTRKNHDYGEAWRDMRVSSITDLILMKLLRIKQIEENDGKTIISEGLDANYHDIINYAVFALIQLSESKQS